MSAKGLGIIVAISLGGSALPEFVTASFLVVIFGMQLRWFPTLSSTASDMSAGEQLYRLVLPVLALVIVYFGYIARMARAGVIGAMEAAQAMLAGRAGTLVRAGTPEITA